MKLGSNISYQNPNSSLNNGITLAQPTKEGKIWIDNGKFMALAFLDADGFLMVDYLQKDTSCNWKVKVKYKSVSIDIFLNIYNYEHLYLSNA